MPLKRSSIAYVTSASQQELKWHSVLARNRFPPGAPPEDSGCSAVLQCKVGTTEPKEEITFLDRYLYLFLKMLLGLKAHTRD